MRMLSSWSEMKEDRVGAQHGMEYYSAIKRNEEWIYTTTVRPQKPYAKWRKPGTKGYCMSYMIANFCEEGTARILFWIDENIGELGGDVDCTFWIIKTLLFFNVFLGGLVSGVIEPRGA